MEDNLNANREETQQHLSSGGPIRQRASLFFLVMMEGADMDYYLGDDGGGGYGYYFTLPPVPCQTSDKHRLNTDGGLIGD
jgi:hypothetical protein